MFTWVYLGQLYQRENVRSIEVLFGLVFLPVLEGPFEKRLKGWVHNACSAVDLEVLQIDSGQVDEVYEFDHR